MIFQYESHPFHIVEERPWPIFIGVGSLFLLIRVVGYFWSRADGVIFQLLVAGILLSFWARDIIREGNFYGSHTKEVELGFKWGMGWFITSEIFFFLAFFWGFFHFRLAPRIEVGNRWPPLGISPMLPFSIPLLNTLILVRSGVSLTWAHHSLLRGESQDRYWGLFLTIFLGIYFTFLQIFEYGERFFCFNDSLYGRIFFLATGFHGLHVIIGTTLLSIVSARIVCGHFRNNHHIGVEISSWYWHFVDVVWLFLFCCMYWWGR